MIIKKDGRSSEVIQLTRYGTFVFEYPRIKTASDVTDINASPISGCCNERNPAAGGFVWRYKNTTI